MSQDMRIPQIQVGSVLSRPKGLMTHRGIYLGNGWVFENTWSRGERLTTFAEFAARGRVRVERVLALPVADIYRRVKASLGRPYRVLTNNCDHALARIEEGSPRSAQLLGWTIAAIAAVCVLTLVRRGDRSAHARSGPKDLWAAGGSMY